VNAGTGNAYVQLDGQFDALGNMTCSATAWGRLTLAVWVRADDVADGSSRYVVDLDASSTSRSANRIALQLDTRNCWAVEVSDGSSRTRTLAAPTPVSSAQLGSRWFFVVAVKSGSRLTLYVDGVQVATTDLGVPVQTDATRGLGIGSRFIGGYGFNFPGAVHSIALWKSALTATEVTAIRSAGNWSYDLLK
jgi:hypothetical protein